jgi:hypothetical protein
MAEAFAIENLDSISSRVGDDDMPVGQLDIAVSNSLDVWGGMAMESRSRNMLCLLLGAHDAVRTRIPQMLALSTVDSSSRGPTLILPPSERIMIRYLAVLPALEIEPEQHSGTPFAVAYVAYVA